MAAKRTKQRKSTDQPIIQDYQPGVSEPYAPSDPYAAIRAQIAMYEIIVANDTARLASDQAVLSGLKALLPKTV